MAIEIRASCERELVGEREKILDQILDDLEALGEADLVGKLQQADQELDALEEERRENLEFLQQHYAQRMRRITIGLSIVAVGVLLQIIVFILKLVT